MTSALLAFLSWLHCIFGTWTLFLHCRDVLGGFTTTQSSFSERVRALRCLGDVFTCNLSRFVKRTCVEALQPL